MLRKLPSCYVRRILHFPKIVTNGLRHIPKPYTSSINAFFTNLQKALTKEGIPKLQALTCDIFKMKNVLRCDAEDANVKA